ncbi:MAG TPA: hypothetical protein VIV11_34510 [Kofleriaceae bacterium]
MRLGLALLVVASGCDGVFGLTHIYKPADGDSDGEPDAEIPVDARPGCTLDPFTGTVTDLVANWDRNIDPGFDVTIEANQLVSQLPAARQGGAWVSSIQRLNMTQATASVEAVEVLDQANGEAIFWVELDGGHYYIFRGTNVALTMNVYSVPDVSYNQTIAYDPVAHRYWRFATGTGMVEFWTSGNGRDWVMRNSMPEVVGLSSMRIGIGGGAHPGGVAASTDARFDNFEYCPL